MPINKSESEQARQVVNKAKEKSLLLTFGDDDSPLALRLFLGKNSPLALRLFQANDTVPQIPTCCQMMLKFFKNSFDFVL